MHKILVVAVLLVMLGCGNDPEQIDRRPTASQVREARAAVSAPASKWYAGGTLQQANLRQWQAGTSQNRLASSADFAAVVAKQNGTRMRSMDDLLPLARSMELCISEASRDSGSGHIRVSEVAASCAILMSQ
jgi:hypothetical protein